MNTIKERIGIVINCVIFAMAAIISGWLFSIEIWVGAIFYGIVAVVSIANGYMMIESAETKKMLKASNNMYCWAMDLLDSLNQKD